MISLLILAILVVVAVVLAFMAIDALLPAPTNFNRLLKVLVALIGLLVFLQKSGLLSGLG